MINHHLTRYRGGFKKRAIHPLVFALFLCSTHFSQAASNWVDGVAYGTNYSDMATATVISSVIDGDGNLDIGFQGTSSIVLSNDINGTLFIHSGSSNLTITATNATVSSWQDSVLSIIGGTNLTITGGNFIGLQGTNVFEYPPIPGQGSQYGYATNAAVGGWINGVQTGTFSNTHFEGTTYRPVAHLLLGTDALVINNSSNLVITGADSEFIGGDGGDIYSASNNASTFGGRGLVVKNSTLSISNGTFHGGSTGDAVAGNNYDSLSIGGDGIYATNSTLEIHGGTFIGGNAGNAMINRGGAGVFAINSDITIEGGSFNGGTINANAYFGLFSRATLGETNNLILSGGTFNTLGFDGEGTQYLTGSNSLSVTAGVFQYDGTLIVTNLTDAPFQTNTVNQGTMRFVRDFELADNGIFHLASHDSHIDFSQNFTVSSGATIWFTATTNGAGLITADEIHFETNSTLAIANNIIGLPVGSAITNSVINASSAIYAGTNLATSANFTNTVNIVGMIETRTGLTDILLDGSTTLSLHFATKPLAEYWQATGDFAQLADELDTMTNQNSALLAKIDEIDLAAGHNVSGPLMEETYFTTFNTFQTSLRGLQAALGQSSARGAEFREELKLIPPGAKGPERKNELRGWAKYYGQFYNHDAEGLNQAYDTTLHGGVFGIDKSLGNLLLGISGGSGRYSTTDNNDGEEEITAYHGALYGTYGMDRAYFDVGIAYGFNQVETQTSEPFVLNGEFDAQVMSAYLGAGYDLIDTQGGTVFTPEASIQYSTYKQDAYSETGTIAVPRNIDAFDADSLRSSLGMNVSMLNTTALETFGFKLDGRAHWLHEFNPEPDHLSFSLDGGSNNYQLTSPMLDEELFRVGFGFSFFNTLRNKPKNVLFRIDFDELFGDGFNSHNLSAKVVYAF